MYLSYSMYVYIIIRSNTLIWPITDINTLTDNCFACSLLCNFWLLVNDKMGDPWPYPIAGSPSILWGGIWSVASQSWVTHSWVTWHCPATCPKRNQGLWRLCGLCHGFGQASKMPKRRLRKNSLFRPCGFPAVFAPTASRVVAKPLASRTMRKARCLSVLLEVTEVDRQGAVKFCSTYTAKLGRCFYTRPWLLEMPCKNGRKPKTEVHGRPKPGFGEKLSSRCARWWKLTHPTSKTWRCRNAAFRRSFDVGNRKVLEACFFLSDAFL